jgi:hypothetical protein
MPRTLPAGILALRGQTTTRAPIFLVEIQWSTPKYYSSAEQVTWNGHVWEKNRAMSIPTFEAGLIDRKHRDFSKLDIQFDNLADNGSAVFPFTALEGSFNLEDARVFVHIYSPDAADAVANVWWGYTAARQYSGEEKSVTISASFFWDALDAPLPTKLLNQVGFGPSDQSTANNEENQDELTVPIIYGVSNLKIRPTIYRKQADAAYYNLNFVLSGCNGQPFQSTDVTAADTKLFSAYPASAVEFLTGTSGQTAPANLTRFPDGAAHPNVAYGFASFPISNEIKDKLDSIEPDDIKLTLVNGRPLLDTTLPSENPVLILKDILRDPNFGMGVPASVFDSTSVTGAANYAGTRYQMRFELHEQKSASEIIQYILANFHGYITFENGLIQIECKQTGEASVATFSTIDSGSSARKIHDDFVDVTVKDSSELINQITIKYRLKKRNNRIVTLYDPTAQTRAGGTYRKVLEDVYDFQMAGGVYVEAQTQILAAIAVREEQNGNLFIKFSSPIWDSLDIAVGDIITVNSPDIFGSNTIFRVTKETIDTENCLISFECQVYKTAVYNDDSVSLGVDLLRGGISTDASGRPPDVTPVSLTVVDVVVNDTEGKEATIRAVWTYPTVDMSTEQSEGIFREYPIAEVELWWHYTDEGFNQSRFGANVKYPATTADIHVPFYKSRSIECFYVAIGANRARSPLGYIPDPTKVTSLTANLAATGALTASVVSSTLFAVNDYVQIEKEIIKVASKAAGSLTFVGATNRTTYFDSISIAHPTGTEVSVAKKSYPSITIPLQRRFTYPVVQNLQAFSTGDGVRFKWEDPDADNIETFLLYWSTDADALSNAAKLGSVTPAWYTADPWTPGTGVNLELVDDHRAKLTQSEIGGVNLTVAARVAATIHRNFSSQLSNSATGVSTGATAPPVYLPSDPGVGDLVTNIVNTDTERADAYVAVRIWADAANHAHTFLDAVALNAVAVFKPTTDSNAEPVKFGGAISDLTQTSVVVGGILPLGQSWQWLKNILNNGAGATRSTGAAYTFVTGGLLQVEPGDAKTVPAPGFGTITREDGGNKIDLVPVYLMQDGIDVVYFKHLFLDVSVNSGPYNRDRRIGLKGIEHLYVTNSLNGAITNSVTTITVVSTAGFDIPTAAEPTKYISIESELIGYTGLTGTTFTGCTRGLDGTTAAAHSNAIRVSGAYREVHRIKRKAAVVAQYRAMADAVGGKSSAATASAVQGVTDADAGTLQPGPLAFPGSLATNTVDGDPEKNLARVSVTVTTANSLSFAANNITAVSVVWVERTEDYGLYVGNPHEEMLTIPGGENTAISKSVDFYVRIGTPYVVPIVYSINGDKRTETDGAIFFRGGNIRRVDTGDTKTVPAPTFFSQPTADGNKIANFTVRLTQDGADIVWFKRLLIEVSYGGGPYRQFEGGDIGLKAIDGLYTSVSASQDFTISCKRKPGVTLDVRATAIAVGGKLSTTTAATQLIASGDDMPQDTAAAGAVVGLGLVWSNKKGWKATWQPPTTNIKSLKGYKVVFFDNAATNFMDPVTGQLNAVNTEAAATKFVPDTSYATLLKYSQVAAQFTGGVKVKVTPVNVVNGVDQDGTATTSSLVSPASDDPLSSDPAAPSSLGTPTLEWSASSKLVIGNLTVGANFNTLRKKYIVIKDAFSHYYNWASPGTATSTESAARLEIGLVDRYLATHTKLKHIINAFNNIGTASPFNLFAHWYAENDFGLSSVSANGGPIGITTQLDFLEDNEAVAVIDVGVTGYTPIQIINNGDFVFGAAATNGNVTSWRSSTLPFSGGSNFTPLSSNVFWFTTDHSVAWNNNSYGIYAPLKRRILPNETLAFTIQVKRNGSVSASSKISVRIRDGNNNDRTVAVADVTLVGLTTSYLLYGGVIKRVSTASTANEFLEFRTDAVIDASNYLIIDKVMLVRGVQPVSYSPRVSSFETGDSTTEDPDITPSTTVTPIDLGNPSGGSQGGSYTAGFGGSLFF